MLKTVPEKTCEELESGIIFINKQYFYNLALNWCDREEEKWTTLQMEG